MRMYGDGMRIDIYTSTSASTRTARLEDHAWLEHPKQTGAGGGWGWGGWDLEVPGW